MFRQLSEENQVTDKRSTFLVTNGFFSHPYHLGESIFIFRCIWGDFSFLFHFSMKNTVANKIAPDVTPRFAGYSVFLCPIKRTLVLYGLMGFNEYQYELETLPKMTVPDSQSENYMF